MQIETTRRVDLGNDLGILEAHTCVWLDDDHAERLIGLGWAKPCDDTLEDVYDGIVPEEADEDADEAESDEDE